MCGEVFDEVGSYSAHLADEHGLHDDDGAESSFGTVVVTAPALSAAGLVKEGLEGPPPRPAGPGDRGRPWGLAVLVLALLLGFVGLLAFGPHHDDDDESDEVAAIVDGETTTTDAPAAGPTSMAVPSSAPAPGGATASPSVDGGGSATSPPTTRPPSGGGGPTTGPAPATTTTTSSTPSTSSPFVAPTTSGARIDACQQVKNRLQITYSWRFDGGASWRAPAGYSPAGGGRYQDVVDVPRRSTTTIDTVQVLDPAGLAHDVALRPVLSSAGC